MNACRQRRVIALGFMLVLGMVLVSGVLHFGSRPTQAQALGLEIRKTLQGSSQVQVGQLLEFTIDIRNTGALTLTRLVVVDEFVSTIVAPSGVGEFAEPNDPPLADPPASFDGNATIRWENALSDAPGGVLPPGETLTLRVRLRAYRPTSDLQIVNRARIEEAIRDDGSDLGQREAESVGAEIGGANAPVEKRIAATQPVQVGQEVPYVISVRNAGLVDLESVPISDFYDPSVLQFLRSVPQPSSVNETQGVLEWDDLLAAAGVDRLRPGESIEITTVYLALRPIDRSINQVQTRNVRDRYENEVEAERAEAPIQIVPAQQTATATSVITATATTPTATATSSITDTATATTTSTATQTASGGGGGGGGGGGSRRATSTPQATATAEETATATATAVTATSLAFTATATSATATPSAIRETATATPIRPATLPITSTPSMPSSNPALLWLLLALMLLLSGLAARSAAEWTPASGMRPATAHTGNLPLHRLLLVALLLSILIVLLLTLTAGSPVPAAAMPISGQSIIPPALLTASLGTTHTTTALTFANNYAGRIARLAADGQHLYVGQGSALAIYRYTTPPSSITSTDTISLLARLPLPGLVEAIQLDPRTGHAYIATGAGGMQVVDLRQPQQPLLLGSVQVPGTARELGFTDEQVYVIASGRDGGVHVLDRQNPTRPFVRATLPITGAVQEIALAGDYAYVAAGFTGGLLVLDLSSSITPTLVARDDTDGMARALAITGTTLLLADGNNGVLTYDISDPRNPRTTSRTRTAGSATDISISGDLVYVGLDTAGVQVFRLNRDQLEEVSRTRITGTVQQVVPTASRLLVATGDAVHILDRTAPATLRPTARLSTLAQARSLVAAGDTLYVAAGEQGVFAYHLSNPLSPTLLSHTPLPGNALKLVLRDELLYVAAANGGVHVLDVRQPSQPLLRSSIAVTGSVVGIDVVGQQGYAALGNQGVQLIDLHEVISPPIPPTVLISGTLPVQGELALTGSAQIVFAIPLNVTLPPLPPEPATGTLQMIGTVGISTLQQLDGTLTVPPQRLADTLPVAAQFPVTRSLPISTSIPLRLTLDLATLRGLGVDLDGNRVLTVTAPLVLDTRLPLDFALEVQGEAATGGVRPSAAGISVSGAVQVQGTVQGQWPSVPVTVEYALSTTLIISDTQQPLPPLAGTQAITAPPRISFSVAPTMIPVAAQIPLSTPLPPITARLLGSVTTGGSAFDVRADATRAYVAAGRNLHVLTVTNVLSPELAVGVALAAGSSVQGMQLRESRLYVVDSGLDSALAVFDLSSSFTPTLSGRLSLIPRGSPYSVQVLDPQQVFVAAGVAGVQELDTTDPAQMVRRSSYDTPGVAHDVAVLGAYVYVADFDGGIQILRRTPLDEAVYLPLVVR